MADVSNLKQNDNDIKRAECRYVYDLDDLRKCKKKMYKEADNEKYNDEMTLMISISITWEVEEQNIV